ncbi:MAG: hypothetical protein WA944_17050 [Mycobacterium sp.]
MKILRGIAAAVVVVGTAVGLPAPAQAAQILEGVFNYTPAEGAPGTWSIFPLCVPVVGDLREPLYLPIGCVLKVSASSGLPSGDARLVSGLWSYSNPERQGIQCADGTWEPTVEKFSFDDRTMSGTRSVSHLGACGTAPSIINTPFTLSFKEPLPIPVDQYPLICEPGGLRRCF